MRFFIKQFLGILVFLLIIFFIQSDDLAGFAKKLNLHNMGLFQKIFWFGLLIVWIVLWNFIMRLFKKNKNQPAYPTVKPHFKQGRYVPPKMRVVSGAILRVNPSQQTLNAASGLQVDDNSPQHEQDLAVLTNGFWGNLNLQCFTQVVYQDVNMELVYSSTTTALVIKVLSANGMWIVDPETGNFINGPVTLKAPVVVLQQQADVLQNVDPGARIIPAVLLMRGSIQNESVVQDYLQKHQIMLLQYGTEATSHAKDLLEVLHELFAPSVSSIPMGQGWEELDEREEQQMLRSQQEANYDQENNQTLEETDDEQ